MIFGIGTDIVAVERFRDFTADGKQAVLERLFTAAERLVCGKRKDAASCFAARFAAKEAFLKALGTGLRKGISWQEIEVSNDALGKPELRLTGNAAGLFHEQNLAHIHLSLSHDAGSAVAMVILEST